MSWREFFGMELDAVEPGHSTGVRLLLAVMVACAAWYVYAVVRG